MFEEKYSLKILILTPYPINQAPSQRFRFEQFLGELDQKEIFWDFQSFLSQKGWTVWYESNSSMQKLGILVMCFVRRLLLISKISQYEFVLIHREAAPFGPPFMEWIISRVFNKKVIFDFDDAIWMNDGHDHPVLWWFKSRWKISLICKWSWRVIVGNQFLAKFASQHNSEIAIIPTVVNTTIHQRKPTVQSTIPSPITIGWTGSHSTLFYLNQILPALLELEKKIAFTFLVIANKNPELPLKGFRFVKWTKETEIEDLSRIEIGVMPLVSNEWAHGKCGFKLIQYLALETPAIASPIGVNTEIIEDGVNGYLASTPAEWIEKISLLVNNPELRAQMGKAGRQTVVDRYSVSANKAKWLEVFKDL